MICEFYFYVPVYAQPIRNHMTFKIVSVRVNKLSIYGGLCRFIHYLLVIYCLFFFLKENERLQFYFKFQIDENVAREIMNHRSLRHPNIIRYKEARNLINFFCLTCWITLCWALALHSNELFSVFFFFNEMLILQVVLTPTHLAIVMEYAAGGELFERICSAGRFSEDEVNSFTHSEDFLPWFCFSVMLTFFPFIVMFRLDISFSSWSPVSISVIPWYARSCSSLWKIMALTEMHKVRTYAFAFILQQICHRDLKLENTLLDGSPAPRLKICDFGYSKVLELVLSSLRFRLLV